MTGDRSTAAAPAEPAAEPLSAEPTYRVIRMVATSPDSWEDAARRGIAEAAKTITNLTTARVSEMDTLVDGGVIVRYRLKLEIAFQVDRARPPITPGQPETEVRRYLVVANKTLAGDLVAALVAERATAGPSEFHVLVPATRSKETQRLLAGASDPLSGYTVVAPDDLAAARVRDRELAGDRLATFIDRLGQVSAEDGRAVSHSITSEVGGHDPFRAIAAVLERGSFDEIIISTLPSSASRWLRIDLPSQVRRAFSLPVVVVHPPNP